MADGRHVLVECDRDRQEHRPSQCRKAHELYGDARGARRLTPPRAAIPPIAPELFYRRDPAAPVVHLGGATMGTGWSAQIVAPPADIADAMQAVLGEMIAALSQWEPDSALSRFNRTPLGAWQALPHTLVEVIDAGLDIARATDGAFDPAAGRLADLWGFGPGGRRADPPDDAAIAAALATSGSRHIERDGPLTRRTADVALDLSGIGKGHAVDALAACLRAAGVENFLVEIGGEFVGAGIRPDAQPWWILLEDPPGVRLPPLRIALHQKAVATSGDYRRFLSVDGRRLGHMIDPATGRPVDNGVVSVSVIADRCMIADAWATALTVLGAEKGLAMADAQGLAARIVTLDGRELLSAALRAMLD